MEPSEERHSFIIRIWIQDATGSRRGVLWRGTISHVPDGARRALHSLDDIAHFIAPYLERMGVNLGVGWRIKRKLDAWSERRRPHATPSSPDKLS